MPLGCTDLTILNSLFKGDPARVAEWIELYLEEAPDYFKRLEAGAATGDAKALAFAAHELRPQAHYLGAPELLELLVLIGEKAGAEGVEACSSAVKEVLGSFVTVVCSVVMLRSYREMLNPRNADKLSGADAANIRDQ